MKIINPEDTGFKYRGMIPEVGEEVTTHWGKALAGNLISGYGNIGTIRLDTEEITWVNLKLTQKFQNPPFVYILYRPDDYGGLLTNESLIGVTVSFTGNWQYDFNEYYTRIAYAISGDYVGFYPNIGTSRYIDVFFKIHGA